MRAEPFKRQVELQPVSVETLLLEGLSEATAVRRGQTFDGQAAESQADAASTGLTCVSVPAGRHVEEPGSSLQELWEPAQPSGFFFRPAELKRCFVLLKRAFKR